MVAQVARDYEGKVTFLTSPGQDVQEPMQRFVREFNWPGSMTHAVDPDGSLWQHLGVQFRGAWIFVNQDGGVVFRTPTHIPEDQVRAALDKLVTS